MAQRKLRRGAGSGLPDLLRHGLVGADGAAQVKFENAAQPLDVLYRNGVVEAELLT